MKSISTNAKLFAILAFIGAIFVFVVLWSFHFQNQMLERNLAQERKTSTDLIDKVVYLGSTALQTIANDYSLWDDMVRFVSTRDQKWPKVNIDPELEIFDVDVIWICDTTVLPIYRVDVWGDSLASAFPLSAEDRDSIVCNNRFHHSFARTKWGLLEIQEAPIQPTSDTLRQSPAKGHFIVGKLWSSAHVEGFSQLTGSQLSIEYSKERMDSLASQDTHNVTIDIYRPLKDLRGQTAAYLVAKKELTDWQNLRRLLLTQIGLMLSFLAVVLIVLAFSLYFWVSRPLTAVSRGLQYENPELLGSLLRQNSEFGKLARLIDESVDQKRSLIKEILERQQAEAALCESQDRLSAITGCAKDGIIMLDANRNVCFWNPAAEQLTGYSADEIMGRPFHNVVVPISDPADSRATFPDNRKTGLDDSLGSTLELKAVRKDGVEVPVEISMSSSILSNRQYAIVIIRDISERKLAEENKEKMLLRQQGASQLLQSLLAPAPLEDRLRKVTDAIVRLFDADFCRIWLIRPGDLCERGCIHAEVHDGPHVCRHRDRCLHLLTSSGRYTHVDGQGHRRVPFGCYKIGLVASGDENKFVTNDANNDPRVHNHAWVRELGLVSFAGYQLRAPGGETLGVLALFAKHPISVDEDAILEGIGSTVALVVKQAVAEESLHRSEAKFRTLYDSTSDAVMLADESGFLDCNKATLAAFGCATREEFCSKHPADVSPTRQPDGTDSLTLANRHIAAAMEKGSNHFEWIHQRVDTGEPFYADVLMSAMELDGKPVVQGVVRDITERKHAEEALRVFKESLDNSTDAIGMSTPQGIHYYQNRAFDRLFGHKGERPLETIYVDKKVGEEVFRTIMSGGEWTGEVKMYAEDGQILDILLRAYANKDENGNTTSIVGIHTNITERKRAEESLREREEFLSSIVENIPDMIFIKDAKELRFVRFNKAGEKLLGHKRDELIGKNDYDLFPREQAEFFIRRDREVLEKGELQEIPEEPIETAKGRRILHTKKIPIADKNGKPLFLLGISRDITERKRIVDALRDKETEYRMLFEGAGVGITYFDLEGRVLMLNTLAVAQLGGGPEEIIGRTMEEILPPSVAETFRASISKLTPVNAIIDSETMIPSPTGPHWYSTKLAGIFEPNGMPVGIQIVTTDISERKQAEEALQAKTSLLEAQTNATADGLLIVDENQRIILTNQPLVELFNIPQHLLDHENDAALLQHVVSLSKYPEEFFEKVMYLYDHTTETSRDVIEFKSGMVLDRYSAPVLGNDGRNYGRIWTFHDITESKRAEEALRESKALMDAIVENVPHMIFLKEATDLRFIIFNRAGEDLLGYDRKDILGKNNLDLFPPEQAANFMAMDREVLDGGAGMVDIPEEPILTAKKGQRLLHTRKVCIRGGDGTTKFLLGISEDITESKQAEETLRESESLYRALIETTGTGYVIVDHQGRVIDANAEYIRLTGHLELDEIRGKSVINWTADHDEEKNAKAVEKCIKTGRIRNLEIDYVDPNGKITPVEVNATVIETRGTPRILSMCRDITTRKQAAGALLESETRLQAIFNKVATGIFIIDSNTQVILDANQTAMEMAGLPREMVVGRICHSLVCPASAGECPVKDLGKKIDHSERKLLHADGHQIDILKTVHPISIGGRDCYLESFIDITDRKLAEAELRESEERFRTLIKNQGEGISIANIDEILTFVNPAAERIFGVEPGALIGKSLFDFVDDVGLAIIRGQTEERSQGAAGSYELEIIRPSGEHRSLLVTATAQHDDRGQYMGSFGVFRDITERKRADEERSKFMSVIDSAPEAIAVLNADGTIRYVNHAFEAISGMGSNQAIDRYYEALARKLYANSDYAIQWDKVQAGESSTETIAYQGNDGGFHLMDQSISAIRSQLGEIINYVVFSRDVTEERELEIRARWADERLRLSIDGMVDGLTLWDVRMAPDGSIQEFVCSEANPAALMMLGKERQDAVGRSVRELLKGAENSDPHGLFLRVHERGQSLTVDRLHLLKGNQRLILTIHVWPIGTGVACHLRDVTQQLELETQLRQAQKLEAVGSLAAGIAHEINTPIQFVGDNIRFLADSFAGLMNVLEHHRECREKMASLLGEREELQQLRDLDRQVDVDYLKIEIPLAVEQSLEGVSRVSSIVRAMKDFSHTDEREMVLADVNQMLDTTLTVARNELKYVADVTKDFAPDLPTVECFRNDLNQVFLNLFINAAHAIGDVVSTEGQGRGTITVATRRDGDEIVVSISDTGGGIPEGIRDRIFDHFFTTKEVGKGTGQGLSIARSIVVEKHKGTITFDSEIGKGTTFYIHLPITRKEVEHAESQHPVRG